MPWPPGTGCNAPIIARNPDHPGALHLYIHAVEASNEPERGVAAADRLRTLVPAAGRRS